MTCTRDWSAAIRPEFRGWTVFTVRNTHMALSGEAHRGQGSVIALITHLSGTRAIRHSHLRTALRSHSPSVLTVLPHVPLRVPLRVKAARTQRHSPSASA